MMWYGVIKSNLSIIVWIMIYSFLPWPTSDMPDEVVILFGNLQFWTTVLLTVLVALGEWRMVTDGTHADTQQRQGHDSSLNMSAPYTSL
jgi:hypothetical protein